MATKTNQKQGSSKQADNKQTSKPIKKIPKDVFETIPYRSIYKNGIIEDYDGRFSKSYRLENTNFDTEELDAQEKMIIEYGRLLNCIDENMVGQLTIINRSIDQDLVRNSILMKPKSDGKNEEREEWNSLFLSLMSEGKNNITKDRIFTVSVKADDIKQANDALKRTDHMIGRGVRKITGQETPPLRIYDRMELFYDIYNCNNGFSFSKKVSDYVDPDGNLNLDKLARNGIMSKYLVAPDSFHFKRNDFMLGDSVYARSFYLDHLPTQLSTNLLDDLTNVPCNMIASVTFIQMDQAKAATLVKNRLFGMNAQINRAQADAAKEGIMNAGVVSSELENARDEAKELISDVMTRDQRIFKVTCVLTVLASSPEELNKQSAFLKEIASGHLCQLRTLGGQQEKAFNTSFPLAQMHLDLDRILTTEASSVFMPFTVQDLNQIDGIYYGINPLSNNLIRYNRKNGSNYNALVFGASGSGKSFIIKEEIAQKFLNSDEYIIIIDPEGEYTKLGKSFGATIINISLDSKTYINPLDMDMQYGGEGENPIPMKCDSIETLIEAMVGSENAITPAMKSIIHRVGQNIYRGYYEHMKEMVKKGVTCDKAAMPTLKDFFSELTKQDDPQAQYLATAIETYCIGTYSIFAERTNVNTNNRFIIYNVNEMSSGLKELAMHVCMNDAWNYMIQNGRKGKWTNLYIDEFHLFTKTVTSASFMKNIYKRARKWHGMPTAITQDISDMFVNEEAEAIINNCSFIIMMNQSPMDRATLADMFKISSELLEHITDQPFGNGLIYTGTTIVPFENEFPQDTKMFELMDSRKKEGDE